MERKFSSFEEIDTRLQTLRLQRELSLQRMRRQFIHSPGEILREGFRRVRPALNKIAIGWTLHQLRELRRKIRPELPKLP
ncbi:MAG: hypothetical protein ACO20F_11260 [Robiginitalea sp.]|jgi:hypothetical protein